MKVIDSAAGLPMPGSAVPAGGDRFAAWLADLTWSKLFPEGRDLYYEGKYPDKFAADIRREFGFDPSADPLWGKRVEGHGGKPGLTSYGFHCPAEAIDAVYAKYGTHRFPGRVRIPNR